MVAVFELRRGARLVLAEQEALCERREGDERILLSSMSLRTGALGDELRVEAVRPALQHVGPDLGTTRTKSASSRPIGQSRGFPLLLEVVHRRRRLVEVAIVRTEVAVVEVVEVDVRRASG